MAETIDAFCEPELALPEVYDLLAGAIGTIASCAVPLDLLPRFSLRLLDLLGLAPPLDRCVHCGCALPSGSVWLDAEAGGFVDGACRERWRDLAELTPHDIENLLALAVPKGGGAAALHATPAAAHAVAELVAHHLGRRPKSVAYLGGLGA
jgi:recombinational DNA repair protein (RecF pathway)